MISAWLKARTREWHALADAQDRVTRGQVTIELRASGATLVDQLRRGQAEDVVAELRKRIT